MKLQITARRELLIGSAILLALWLVELTVGVLPFQRLIGPVVWPVSEQTVHMSRSVALPLYPLTHWYGSQQRAGQIAEQLAQAEGKMAQLEQLQAENAQLRVLLENRHTKFVPRHLARPIVSSLAPLVWLGEDSAVKPGWLVTYKDTILGQVTSVVGQYAHVALLTTDPELRLVVQTPSGIRGVAQASNGRVVVSNIAPDALIKLGERMTTVGQPGVAPGKLIGQIVAVEKAPNTAAQTIIIDQLVSFYQTSVVEIEE